MFSIYGISGPVFHGSLEELELLPAVNQTRRVRPVVGKSEGDEAGRFAAFARLAESGAGKPVPAPAGTAEALHAYASIEHADVERGPLYSAGQLMRRQVITVYGDDPAERAYQVLLGNAIRQAPVLDREEHVIGIVGEHNLLAALKGSERMHELAARRVAEVMSSPVVCADPATDVRRIARVMLDDDVDGVPIVNEHGGLIGFVSRSDILGAVVAEPPLSLWR
jgi:CBS domain-containing protein